MIGRIVVQIYIVLCSVRSVCRSLYDQGLRWTEDNYSAVYMLVVMLTKGDVVP